MRSALKLSLNNGVSLATVAAALLLANVPASAQSTDVETVVVTGFRASLKSAINAKRDAIQVMDAISAEDIGKFPDKDMGEALQRVTGVQLTRNSGGEGSTVTIRGGDPSLTRVEINGTGALSVTANGSDRAIDFRDLPVEFVNRLEVVKSPTADMIEGGIGGTVRVITRRPLNSKEPFFEGSAQGIQSNLSRSWDPKFALIGSKLFFNDTLGVLLSGVYSQEHLYDGQALTTGWLQQAASNSAQGLPGNECGSYFPATPVAIPSGVTPAAGVCGTGNPQGKWSTATPPVASATGDWYPQIPRYFNNRRFTTRVGINSAIEYRPTDKFKFFWDVTYANAKENVNNQALQINDNGGLFDYAKTTVGADYTVNHIEETSNGAQAQYYPTNPQYATPPQPGTVTNSACTNSVPKGVAGPAVPNTVAGCLPLDVTFRNILGYLTRVQLTNAIGGSYDISDEFTVDARLDVARSRVDNEETDATGVQYGTPRSVVDYTGSQHAPDITLPGTDLTGGSGINDLSAYYVPVSDRSAETAYQANVTYKPASAPWLQIKAGYLRHEYNIVEVAYGKQAELTCRGTQGSGNKDVVNVPCSVITGIESQNAGTNPIPFYSTGNLGFSNEIRTWLDQNMNVVKAVEAASGINIYDLSTPNPNNNTLGSWLTYLSNWKVAEGTTDWYGEALLDFPNFYLPVSGNVGLRYVDTKTESTGYAQNQATTVASNGPPLSGPAVTTVLSYPVQTVKGSYTQMLPSANLKFDLVPLENLISGQLLARLAYGKVMARPNPTQLALNEKTDIVGLTGSIGNPGLLPYLSTDYDAGLEWYFQNVNMISAGYFQKDISRFIINTTQPETINGVTYSMTFPTNGTTPVTIKGIEATFQYTLDWLPKPLDGFGVLANWTMQKDSGFKQTSLIDGTPLPYPGLSRMAYNYSVYYDNEDISARLSYVWRSHWLINAAGRGNLPEWNASYGEVDASVSYNFTPELSIFADGINLTDQQLVQYNAPARPIQFDTFGTRLYFGVRAKY